MIYIFQNWLPILAAGLVGALLLGARLGRGVRPSGAAAPTALLMLLALCWLAAILAGALILAPVAAGRWTVALGSAFIIWVGFVAPALLVTLRARGIGWSAAAGDATWWLLVMLAMAATLRLIGLTSPA